MKKILSIGFSVMLLGMAVSASADIINGGFESGLTGWTSTGTTSVTSAGFDIRTNNALSTVGVGTQSVKVGDEIAWGFSGPEYSSVSQSWAKSSTFDHLYFAWAAVFSAKRVPSMGPGCPR